MSCRIEDLDRAYGAMLGLATDYEIAIDGVALADEFPQTYAALRSQFNPSAIGHCLGTYIQAELDSQTPGDRGLGRVSTHIPRLAAHLRRGMSRLTRDETMHVAALIQDAALRGYLTYALLVEKPLRAAKYIDGASLYHEWLPVIYSGANADVGPNLRQMLEVFSDPALQSLADYFTQHRVTPGLFGDDQKTRLVIAYYPLAGLALRAIEVGAAG